MSLYINEFEKIKNVFANRISIQEISVNTEGKTEQEVVKEILKLVNH
jgi:hypothetical protein